MSNQSKIMSQMTSRYTVSK